LTRPNLYELNSWQRHESRVVEVFQEALCELARRDDLPEEENPLNRQLLRHVKRANYRLVRSGRGTRSNVYYEANNQPIESDEHRAARESKRPDFKCGMVDADAEVDLFLDIECKRLGSAASRKWVFNQNYTTNGVRRFDDPEWGYGADCSSGVMIGYVQSMDWDQVLDQVNAFGEQEGYASIESEGTSARASSTTLQQRLNRRTPPSPFALRHLWIDLRDAYTKKK
jgi:hypothetical protein